MVTRVLDSGSILVTTACHDSGLRLVTDYNWLPKTVTGYHRLPTYPSFAVSGYYRLPVYPTLAGNRLPEVMNYSNSSGKRQIKMVSRLLMLTFQVTAPADPWID